MTGYADLERTLTKLATPKKAEDRLAYLGYAHPGGQYQIRVGNSPTLVWIRLVRGQTRNVTQAINTGNVPHVPDLPVKYELRGNEVYITGMHDTGTTFLGEGVPNFVADHSHEPGYMVDPVSARRLRMGLVRPYKVDGAFTNQVYIEPLWYVYEGQTKYWPGGTYDLDSSVPPVIDMLRWAKFGLNPATNTIVVTYTASSFAALTKTQLADLSFGVDPCIPLAGLQLKGMQAAIDDEWMFEDISPWRSGIVSGGGDVDAADVTYTPLNQADWGGVEGEGGWIIPGDPGNVDDALDQLAERVQDLEDAPPGSGDMLKSVYDSNDDGRVNLAVDSDTVDGQHAAAFATAGHNHTGVYAPVSHDHAGVYAPTAHTHDDRYFTEAEHLSTSSGAGDAGKPIKLNASGQVDGSMLPAGNAVIHQALLYFAGTLEVGSSPLRIYNATGTSKTISKVFLACDTAPTGSAIICDVHKNGVTIFTTQSNRPQIAAGTNTGQSTSIDVSTWAADEYITAHIDQIGSTIAGKDLVLHIVYS